MLMCLAFSFCIAWSIAMPTRCPGERSGRVHFFIGVPMIKAVMPVVKRPCSQASLQLRINDRPPLDRSPGRFAVSV